MNQDERQYISGFVKYVKDFMSQHRLFPLSGKAYFAVSAGMDSMCLLDVLNQLIGTSPIKQIEVIHINHGTRSENAEEESLVRKRCLELGIPCNVERLHLGQAVANFETIAREKRYRCFKYYLKAGDLLYTAHHLDDSFEWSLMQQLKSSKSSLGIPLINGTTARPFLCLTRDQINHYVRVASVSYCEDPSNSLISYERNFVRNKLVPEIKARFPGYLKHYAHRSNMSAFNQKRHRLSDPSASYQVEQDIFGGIIISKTSGTKDYLAAGSLITDELIKLSTAGRGVLAQQVDKLINMVGPAVKGPLLFSGHVLGFSSNNVIYLISQNEANIRQRLDRLCSEKFDSRVTTYIPMGDFNYPEKLFKEGIFPYLVFFKKGTFPSLKIPHPLMEKTCQKALDLGFGFNTLSKIISLIEKKKYFNEHESIRMVTHNGLLDYLK